MATNEMSRRTFLAGSVITAATIAAGTAMATEKESASNDGVATSAASDAATYVASNWLGEPPAISEESISQTVDADVVVVGAGTGGWFAACSAAEEGAKVMLVEKTEKGADVRGDLGGVNSRYQQADGCEIDEAGILFDLYRYSNGNSSYALHRTWYENSGEAIDWYGDLLEKSGVTLWHELATEDPKRTSLAKHWPVGHSPEWPVDGDGNPTLSAMQVMGDYFASKGGQVMYKTAMVKLEQDENDVVTGIVAQAEDGSYLRINAARGVILATGGYGRNTDMLATLQPDTMRLYSLSIAKPGATGDGIRAALWAGAAMDGIHSSMLFDRCALPPTGLTDAQSEEGMFFNMGSHPWLKVNLAGERFTNEGSGVYDWMMHAGAEQPDRTYCTIWDNDWQAQAKAMDMHGCARMYPYENGAPANETTETIGKQLQSLLDAGYVQQADTFEELAEKLGIPADTFAATVERYNDLAETGVDEDFGKEPFRMIALKTPPFYGVRNSGILLCTLDGIRIDTSARALRVDGSVIEGLYVVGNDSGNYFATTYPNTLTGGAAGRTLTFGRIAGKAAATRR